MAQLQLQLQLRWGALRPWPRPAAGVALAQLKGDRAGGYGDRAPPGGRVMARVHGPYLTPMYSNKIKIKNKVRSHGIAMAEGISYPVYSKGTNRCSRCTV